jgi:hypothetical protein
MKFRHVLSMPAAAGVCLAAYASMFGPSDTPAPAPDDPPAATSVAAETTATPAPAPVPPPPAPDPEKDGMMALGTETPGGTPIEQTHIILAMGGLSKQDFLSDIDVSIGLVRDAGYHCDSVSDFSPWILSRGFTLTCNNFNYEYYIADKGGNWVVSDVR